jgi:hypothetical protein
MGRGGKKGQRKHAPRPYNFRMPCLVVLLAFTFPRVAIVVLWMFSDFITKAYQNTLWPILGLIFLPYTTLGYAFAMNANNGNVTGGYLVLVIVCVLIDVGVLGGGAKARTRVARVEEPR